MAGELLRSHRSEIGEHLEMSSMANSAAVGIEYVLQGRWQSRRKMIDGLLRQGIALCSVLEKASRVYGLSSRRGVSTQQVLLYTIFDSLASVAEQVGGVKIAEVPRKAKHCRVLLQSVLEKPEELPGDKRTELESCRDFLNDLSTPYLECAERGLEEHRRGRGVDYI